MQSGYWRQFTAQPKGDIAHPIHTFQLYDLCQFGWVVFEQFKCHLCSYSSNSNTLFGVLQGEGLTELWEMSLDLGLLNTKGWFGISLLSLWVSNVKTNKANNFGLLKSSWMHPSIWVDCLYWSDRQENCQFLFLWFLNRRGHFTKWKLVRGFQLVQCQGNMAASLFCCDLQE